ncbi:hypothetical protein P152DRAFT_454143 [Eremomyces bilateralis CBS 781.70]|uniref:Uncharacterized protein n=1 Tax=Eremomyces bilateralis CBS 781.70 TaxID=1392243 RepID=A0A6G1GHK6_9PEZI|nr:uncharacterized protein P152DRAFT_454143 [Eremomyces bilateralis CBS 781.70]KAF1817558.1 hypothetical protein P152DRAFT_454143 [Eremomyces bilateralis CBS 781.70]
MAPSKDSNSKDESTSNCTNPYDPFRALKGFVNSQIQLITDMTDQFTSSIDKAEDLHRKLRDHVRDVKSELNDGPDGPDKSTRPERETPSSRSQDWWQEMSAFLEEGRKKAQEVYSLLENDSRNETSESSHGDSQLNPIETLLRAIEHEAERFERAMESHGGLRGRVLYINEDIGAFTSTDFLWQKLYDPMSLSMMPPLTHVDWNRAFEDLRLASQGSHMTAHSQWKASNREQKADWDSKRQLWEEVQAGSQLAREELFEPFGLYRRIRDTLGDVFHENRPAEDSSSTLDPETELDMFDRFQKQEDYSPDQSTDARGRIIRTVHREEERVFPDGHVEKRSTKSKIYEDGSEDVSENVDDNGSRSTQDNHVNSNKRLEEATGRTSGNELQQTDQSSDESSSWFWK